MANHAGRIAPPLEDVASDKKFFGPPFPADYPHDTQPHASREAFQKGPPYPKIQEQGFFDKDYLKDENSDGGEWQAQMEYDNARTRVDRRKQHVDQVEKKAHAEAHDVEEAANRYKKSQTTEQQAADAATRAEEKEDVQKHAEYEARHHMEEKEVETKAKVEAAKQDAADEATKVLEKRVDDATEALSTERESFKNCQKELDEAKAKVEKLMKQKEELSQTEGAESTLLLKERRLVEDQERILREQRAKTVVAEAGHDSALSKLEVSRNETEASRKELARQQAEQKVAEEKLKKVTQELEESDKELADARTQLRKQRGLDALPAGEIMSTTKPVKSHAARGTKGLVAAALLLLAVSS